MLSSVSVYSLQKQTMILERLLDAFFYLNCGFGWHTSIALYCAKKLFELQTISAYGASPGFDLHVPFKQTSLSPLAVG